jgi:hypothetical protein
MITVLLSLVALMVPFEELMVYAPGSVAPLMSVFLPPESLLGGTVDLQAPGSWSENHTEVAVPVEVLQKESQPALRAKRITL